MIGIIYKFTILARYRMDEHKPFYVGQRWERKSVDKFLSRNCSNYNGSGTIWNDFLNRLKKDYPKNWRKLVKREVLYVSEMVNQKGLDVLEEYYIKKEKAHYSYGLGGTNVLWGTANKFGSGSPAKDPLVKKKMSDAMQIRLKHGWKPKNNLTEEHYRKHSEFMKEYFKTHQPHNKGKKIPKENHPMYGKHHSEETRRKMKENHADFSGKNNPFYGDHRFVGENNPFYGKRHSKENKERQSKIMKEYYRNHVNPMKGKHRVITDSQRVKQSKTMSQTIWITDGIDNKRININLDIPNGWRRGRTGYVKKKIK